MSKNYYKKLGEFIYEMTQDIYNDLGSGFPEAVYQNAIAIELRDRNIEYLKEVNIEIFYKEHSVGTDRPDFILLSGKIGNVKIKEPIVLEMKVASSLSNDNRQQLKSYFTSLPQNKDSRLKKIVTGVLLKIPKSEDFVSPEKTKPIEVEVYSFKPDSNIMKLEWKPETV